MCCVRVLSLLTSSVIRRLYLRVMIRTGQLLAEIAQELGYELVRIDLFRTRFATATKEQLREEVVVLRLARKQETSLPDQPIQLEAFMRLRGWSSLASLAFIGALLLATIVTPTGVAAAAATPKAAAATPAGPPTDTPTPAPTRTPAPTPTATATLTELQNRLLLADTYLKAGQSAKATELYSAILAQERGQPEALAGLKKALEGQTALTATAAAPRSHGRASHSCAALGTGLRQHASDQDRRRGGNRAAVPPDRAGAVCAVPGAALDHVRRP